MVPLLVEGKANEVIDLTDKYEGKIRLRVNNLFSLEIPAKNVISFSDSPTIQAIDFNLQAGQSLSDTMLIQTGVDSVIQINDPLTFEPKGQDVILGFIDSGIELNHGDFQDSLGNTRVLYVWDQRVAFNPNRQANNYNYGVEWDSSAINAGLSTHDDNPIEFGHGSMVTGAAASNANASGNYRGIAPNADIISVATDFNKPNWLQTVAEAVDYIYTKADSLGKPCVINASIGTYRGSHDGRDIAARMIDQMIKQRNGRSFVCAAGNAGNVNFHLRHEVNNDTVFSWFLNEPRLFAGFGGVYYEIWSDSVDFSSLRLSFGADRENNGQFEFRGRTPFKNLSIYNFQLIRDSITSLNGNHLAYVDYYIEKSQGRYKVEVAINNPDSAFYLYRLETSGSGKLDIWTTYNLQRSSSVKVNALPNVVQFPDISRYVKTDSLQTMVSSFTCLPSAITVGNYINRNTYIDATGVLQNMGATPGKISQNSSLGPNRNGHLKPDISSAGDFMMSAGRLGTINTLLQTQPSKISQDSLHMRNGGTSMASPTVAGMVALYLEMCPNASYQSIINDIISSSKSDQYTTNLPNPKWGAGKADAFRLLSNKSFKVNLNYSSTDFCDRDSVLLSTVNNFNLIIWNGKDTMNQFNAKTSGHYYAQAYNNQQCKAFSDTILLQFFDAPIAPILTQSNDTIFSNGIGLHQWYFNNALMIGETRSFLPAANNGFYHCTITDPTTQCTNHSDTLNFVTIGLSSKPDDWVTLYPMPASNFVQLDYVNNVALSEVTIYNFKGQKVSDLKLNGNKHQIIPLERLDNGFYIIEFVTKEKIWRKRIIIQH